MKKAIAYARFSSDMQREESIDAQLRAIKEYCNKNKILLIEKFYDEGISGTTDERPQFQAMIKYTENNDIDYVIVHKLDRFSRSKYDSVIYKQKLRNNGTSVISVLENLDDSPESLILESVLEGMSEYYSRNLSREVKKGLRENALKAKFNGGTPPLGYDVDENKNYIINPYEAEAVRLIFNMYVLEYGYSSIIEELNQKGYKTKKGLKFGKNSLYEILGNEKYIGNYLYSKEDYNGFSKKRNSHKMKSRENMIVLEGAIPAIIDMEIWRKAMEIRESNKKTKAKYKAKREYILNSLVYCGNCGKVMTGTTRSTGRGNRYYYYRCNCGVKSVRADKLEELVLDCVDNVLFNNSNINAIIESMSQYLKCDKTVNCDDKVVQNEISEIEKQLDNLILFVAEHGGNDKIKLKIEELENKKQNLKNLVVKNNYAHEVDVGSIKKWLTAKESIKSFSPKEQRIILKLFIEKIEIEDKTARISLKLINVCGLSSGAERGTWTPTRILAHAPQTCLSADSSTSAKVSTHIV